MLVVMAMGGNALLERGQPFDASTQRHNVRVAATAIAEVARDHSVVVTHGNGPQVGLLALQAAACADVSPYPLDVLGAESEGMIGYLIEQELTNQIPGREIATLLTQVVVRADDPAFDHPTKPIGPSYEKERALAVAEENGWSIAPDGDRFRRVVPSPRPLEILQLAAIRLLVEAGVLVICAGGGGIPVVRRGGVLEGVEAVIEKDLSAALLARELGADGVLYLTDVDAVWESWGQASARAIAEATPGGIRQLDLPEGSMGPKVEAAASFVESGGGFAAIGRLRDAAAILRGVAGTRICPGPELDLRYREEG
jgi:carbamate kinase